MSDTTLTADQSADAVEAFVAGNGPRSGDFIIKIDSEYELVEWRGDQHARPWQVQRGYLGTAPAAHSSGATVSVEPALGGGGSIGATVIGPFAVTYQTAGITGSPGALVGPTLAAGTIVLRAWLAATVTWTSTNQPQAGVGVCKLDTTDGFDLVDYNDVTPFRGSISTLSNPASFVVEADWLDNGGLMTTQAPIPAVCEVDARLYVYVIDSMGGALTAGAGRVYAEIQAPS